MSKGSSHGELLLRDGRQRQIPVSYVTIVHHAEDDEPSLLSFVMRDISAQKQAEAANLERERKILQVQKAESLSVLAGGIAHDFNNLLTAIIGNASLLREELLPGERTQGPLDQIEIAAGRAAELCGNMLAYAGRFRAAKADINVNTIVEESRELIHAAISKKIRIETNLSPDLSPIHGSALQLQQVIINLALNASEAIGDKAGVIALRTSLRQLTPKEMAESFDQPAASNGRYVILEIKDSGCGIPDDIRGKIFEPYFTTKSNGHGLGLAAVNGIVRAHGGAVTVESTIGQGSTFRVLLPATKAASGGSSLAAAGPERCHGSGLALIVDDEPFVREVVAKLIERFGFKTVTAADGIEGVARFKDHHRDLKFVLTDLTMPRMNGDEAMAEMRRINASIPVILMSGYPEKMAADHFALASPSALLAKPLRREVLEKTINQVLQRT